VFAGLLGFFTGPRRTGLKIIVASTLLGVLAIMPLLLYVMFGPEDGNPIGLGLLSMLGLILIQAGVVAGLIWLLVEILFERRR
jgi:hypothetical protein